ncbi:MAG: biopolymer transporter ExbD [Candidatus Cloacimonadota bacterium]|nr:biopolymer transporter ExbD [Candidatus Cloacimonadota bacterium]
MKIKKKKRDLAGIPTASMSDVAFLLLVFFLTTTKFDIKKGLSLMLPEASANADVKVKLKDDNLTKIKINKEGLIALEIAGEEEIVELTTLERKIRSLINANPEMVLQVKTDRRSKYDNMVKVLDILQLAGAEKISLSTN